MNKAKIYTIDKILFLASSWVVVKIQFSQFQDSGKCCFRQISPEVGRGQVRSLFVVAAIQEKPEAKADNLNGGRRVVNDEKPDAVESLK